jgi:ornithine cyclodeaminase
LVEEAGRSLGNGESMNAPRQRVRTGTAMLHVLPAASGSAHALGLKAYTTGPQGAKFWLLLFAGNGELLALMQADHLGQIRTGAASGVATRHMSRPQSRSVGIIGTGYQARTQLEAVCAVRPIERVRAWGRTRERLEAFCREMSEKLARPVEPAPSARAAVDGADIVVTITSASQPVVEGAWLSRGTHVNAAGSNRASAREIDGETVARAGIIAVEDVAQAKVESGDLRLAVDEGRFRWERAVTLGAILAGKTPGRTSDDQITLFESLGIGLWDVVAAAHVYQVAVERGFGTELPIAGVPERAPI